MTIKTKKIECLPLKVFFPVQVNDIGGKRNISRETTMDSLQPISGARHNNLSPNSARRIPFSQVFQLIVSMIWGTWLEFTQIDWFIECSHLANWGTWLEITQIHV